MNCRGMLGGVTGLMVTSLLLGACTSSEPASTSEAGGVRATPEPGASWDYVALGDSTPAGFGAVGRESRYVAVYASYIEADLGVTATG